MSKGANTRGELLVWPGIGPISSSEEAADFENYINESFGVRVVFVENMVNSNDILINLINEGRDGSEIIFRMFCINAGIYPLSIDSSSNRGYDSIKKN